MAMVLRDLSPWSPTSRGRQRTVLYRPLKRCVDITISSAALILLSPVMLVIALIIKLDDGGPVLFHQRRVGHNGKEFTMLKFRTMRIDAEELLPEVTYAQAEGELKNDPKLFKLKKDPRIIRSGTLLRQFSLDELPQFFNVLVGDMSLIGPRPPLVREADQYCDEEKRRLSVKPGMTGLWQVSGRSNLTWDETIKRDLYYVDNHNSLLDFRIFLKTFKAVLSRDGAY
ncbi:sugar transferase [Corynebacterium cystitidis]|uniref:sugar transferase n=2 Tax=Corynebacterium cystitidis TaxID=35757 RepID=UPI0027B88D7D|nr:sugar transferase [Corynebacterium cystitidis]